MAAGLVTGLNVACRAVDGDVLTTIPVTAVHVRTTLVRTRADDRGSGASRGALALGLAGADRRSDAADPSAAALSPHNPVGRAWQADELAEIADFCTRHDLIVCSDEIHCDLMLEERRHVPLAMGVRDIARRSITLMAPSKTFNVPGLGCAFAIIPDPVLRRTFTRAMAGIVPHVNLLGLIACEAALRDGGAWQQALLAVLRRNRDLVQATVDATPGVSMTPVEATYLAWIDVRGLGLQNPHRHFEAHGLGLSDGADFGAPGWLRLNFGCPLPTLQEALRRFSAAVEAAESAPNR